MTRHRSAGARRAIARWPLVAVAAVALLVLGWAGWTWLGGVVERRDATAAQGCVSGVRALPVAAAPGVADALTAIAEAWNATGPVVDDVCFRAEVRPLAGRDVLDGLSGGWDPARLGPRPAAWLPDSSTWVDQLAARDRGLLGSEPRSVATSPVVLAVAPQAADALRAGPPLRWADLPRLAVDPAGWGGWGRAGWGSVDLVVPDVADDPAGALALQAVLVGATRGAGPLTVPALDAPPVRLALTALAGAAGTAPDGAAALDGLGADPAAAPVDAVPVIEQDLHRRGGPLTAVAPQGPGPVADFPFVALTGADGGDAAVGAAQLLRRALEEPAAQQRLAATGLRVAGAALPPAPPGLPWAPDPEPLAPADPDAAQQLAATWVSAAGGGQAVTLVVDASGSTGGDGGGGRSRLDWVRDAVTGQVDRTLTGTLALWEASAARPLPERELVAAGSLVTRRGSLLDATAALTPRSTTSLHETLLAAHDAALRDHRPGVPNRVVVITDGTDEADVPVDVVVQRLTAAADPARPVPVSVIALGPDADRAALTRIAAATGGTVSVAEDGAAVAPALGQLLAAPSR